LTCDTDLPLPYPLGPSRVSLHSAPRSSPLPSCAADAQPIMLLQYAPDNGEPQARPSHARPSPRPTPARGPTPVAGGHIKMIEFIIRTRKLSMSSVDVATPAIAVKHGQLHVLEWMWKQPYFVSNNEFRERAIEFACEAACDAVIDHERFDAFDWLRTAGYGQELTKEQPRDTSRHIFHRTRSREKISYSQHRCFLRLGDSFVFWRWVLLVSSA